MNNISIKYRIFPVAVVAMVGMIATISISLLEKSKEAIEMARFHHLGNIATVASDFVHELQKERGGAGL